MCLSCNRQQTKALVTYYHVRRYICINIGIKIANNLIKISAGAEIFSSLAENGKQKIIESLALKEHVYRKINQDSPCQPSISMPHAREIDIYRCISNEVQHRCISIFTLMCVFG